MRRKRSGDGGQGSAGQIAREPTELAWSAENPGAEKLPLQAKSLLHRACSTKACSTGLKPAPPGLLHQSLLHPERLGIR